MYQLYQLYQLYQMYQTKQNCVKIAAEELCRHFAFTMGLPSICLRTARFFPEAPELMALYRLYRGMDVRDAVAAQIALPTYLNSSREKRRESSRSSGSSPLANCFLGLPLVKRTVPPGSSRSFFEFAATLTCAAIVLRPIACPTSGASLD